MGKGIFWVKTKTKKFDRCRNEQILYRRNWGSIFIGIAERFHSTFENN
jgi:hypothetical protein